MKLEGWQDTDEEAKLQEMAAAVHDSRFMSDLCETMSAFAAVDAEWWEMA
jgi:hypothetical protein